MKPATWANCRADLAFDGALVDLLVPGTGPAAWEALWAALRSGPFGLRVLRDGGPVPLPESPAWFLAEQEQAAVTLSVRSGTITANCHLFGGELRLDIDPREVTGEEAFGSVLAVMRFVAAALDLPVLAVPEGGPQRYAFIRVSPDGQAAFLPPGR